VTSDGEKQFRPSGSKSAVRYRFTPPDKTDCYRFCYSFSGQKRAFGAGKRAPMFGK